MKDGHTSLLAQADARRLPLPDLSVDLVFGSPPYTDARVYLENGKDLGISRNCVDWIEWMLDVTTECLRVSRGAVLWVAAGVTRNRNYQPSCEGLMWKWFRRGLGHAYRPCYWHRVGIPGSGGDDWFRFDVEYVMCFKRPGRLSSVNPLACGKPAKSRSDVFMTNRRRNGSRVGFEFSDGKVFNRKPTISQSRKAFTYPDISNPGTLISTGVGGSRRLGAHLAHENEAPFPEALAEHFIRSFCPEGGTVLDPFSGSATTVATALRHGRRGIGFDLRRSQCELGARRIPDSLRPVSKLDVGATIKPATGQMTLFALESAS